MEQLLIVEDDPALNQGLCKALREPERRIVSCACMRSAREQMLLGTPALAILDIGLPDGSGLDLLREWKREAPGMSVILLTANDTDEDIVEGLELGADDYVTKPFSLSVLRARVRAQLRRTGSEVYRNARFSFDFARMTFAANGRNLELSRTEARLLRILCANEGATLSRAVLVDRIWTDGAEYVDENALSVAVKRLRDKLGAQDAIRTVYGIGYAWMG